MDGDYELDADIERLIREDCMMARAEARVPPPELVWMRAEVRARENAARRAMRPLVVGQAIGIAASAGLLVAWLSRLSASELPRIPLPLVEMVAGSWLLLAPIAVYLALSRDNR